MDDPSDVRLLAGEVLGVSKSLFLAVTTEGFIVPGGFESLTNISLGVGGTLLVASLGAGTRTLAEAIDEAARVSGDADALWTLAGQLADRGLIGAGLAAACREPLPNDPASVEPENVEWFEKLVLPTPMIFPLRSGTFEYVGHDGRMRARLDALHILGAIEWRFASTVAEAYSKHAETFGEGALGKSEFRQMARELLGAGLLAVFDADDPTHNPNARFSDEMFEALQTEYRIKQAVTEAIAAELADPGGAPERVNVVPVNGDWRTPPAALGLVVAYARALDGGVLDDSYRWVPSWYTTAETLAELASDPGVYLFSNYIWQHSQNLSFSAQVKALNPWSITVHGGPDTPKYEHDLQRYFDDNPHVDVTVRGEGEATFADMMAALRGHVGNGPPDLSVLADVAGLSYRDGDRVVTTGERDRIADLDTIPSPVLNGMFDTFAAGPASSLILESNRGCPYGCTFCDWGSATLSRVRKFSLDRFFAELEWCAQHKIKAVGIADANFGIFERDVEIAEKCTQLKAEYGYPQWVGNNYAKNTVKHLSKIIKLFADAGIVVEGAVSLQSMDEPTLIAVKRKNIKVEKYNDLSTEFRNNGLPLAVELMMGLPGMTPASFRKDLQECVNRGVRARVNPTFLLPNSPMNEPSYRAEHGITAMSGELVKQTNTFTEADWDEMESLRKAFLLCDRFGVLRQVGLYVRSETGIQEIDFYQRLLDASLAEPEKWPVLAFGFRSLELIMAPPGSWKLFLDEVRRFAIDELGVADDAALATAMAVQLALIPARDRSLPEILEVEHDFAGWYQQILESKEAGHRHDWEEHVPHLRESPPATFAVADPDQLCAIAVGLPTSTLSLMMLGWDLDSPVARAWLPHAELAAT